MTTWLLLRGLTRESRHWGHFPETLRDALGGARVVTLDLPGNGRQNHLESPASVERMADACHERLRALDITPPCAVLAMSLGAMVAVAWATRHAEDIAGCVLVNTSLRPFSPIHHRLRPRTYPLLLSLMLAGGGARREAAILALTSNRPPPDGLLADWVALHRESPVTRRNALRQLWAASRYGAGAVPPAPTLVLASAHDRLVDPRCSRELARCWNVPCVEHPSAGHDLPLDDGPWVAAQAAAWARGVMQPTR